LGVLFFSFGISSAAMKKRYGAQYT